MNAYDYNITSSIFLENMYEILIFLRQDVYLVINLINIC